MNNQTRQRTGIDCENFRNDEHAVSVGLHAKTLAAFEFLHGFLQRDVHGNLVSSGAGDDATVFECVFDGAKAIVNGILNENE